MKCLCGQHVKIPTLLGHRAMDLSPFLAVTRLRALLLNSLQPHHLRNEQLVIISMQKAALGSKEESLAVVES